MDLNHAYQQGDSASIGGHAYSSKTAHTHGRYGYDLESDETDSQQMIRTVNVPRWDTFCIDSKVNKEAFSVEFGNQNLFSLEAKEWTELDKIALSILLLYLKVNKH